MTVFARTVLACAMVATLAPGCARVVDGTALAEPGSSTPSAVDVDGLMLDQSRMRAITGAGDDLTIIPTMDGKYPVDIELLAETAPVQCRFVFNETEIFGRATEQFHKTTFQNPPDGGLISQAAASYRDAATAGRALADLAGLVKVCGSTSFGPMFVGQWTADGASVHTRPGACGRDYRVKSVVLIEVTFCGFGESVPDIVMTNILNKIPG